MKAKQSSILSYVLLVAIGGFMVAMIYTAAAPIIDAVTSSVSALLAGR